MTVSLNQRQRPTSNRKIVVQYGEPDLVVLKLKQEVTGPVKTRSKWKFSWGSNGEISGVSENK